MQTPNQMNRHRKKSLKKKSHDQETNPVCRYPRRSQRLEIAPAQTPARAQVQAQSVSSLSPAPTIESSSAGFAQRPSPVSQPDAGRRGSTTTAAATTTAPESASSAAATLFFGESNFLTLVPGDEADSAAQSAQIGSSSSSSSGGRGVGIGTISSDASSTQKPRLTFPIPGSPASQSLVQGAGISAGTMRYLRDEGALTLPDLQTCLPALQAYFTWFHPSFPILDRAEVTRRLAAMDISRFLLQAMLFIGATYCGDSTIVAMGFKDRSEAKRVLYTRARLLFHADWEKDEIILIQSIFLMSFWRGGPADVRDVRYWLGVVITLSESYGLHRS